MNICKKVKDLYIQRKAEKLFDIAWDRSFNIFYATILDFQKKLHFLDPLFDQKCRMYFELILCKNLNKVFANEKFTIMYGEIEYVGKTCYPKKKPFVEAFYED